MPADPKLAKLFMRAMKALAMGHAEMGRELLQRSENGRGVRKYASGESEIPGVVWLVLFRMLMDNDEKDVARDVLARAIVPLRRELGGKS